MRVAPPQTHSSSSVALIIYIFNNILCVRVSACAIICWIDRWSRAEYDTGRLYCRRRRLLLFARRRRAKNNWSTAATARYREWFKTGPGTVYYYYIYGCLLYTILYYYVYSHIIYSGRALSYGQAAYYHRFYIILRIIITTGCIYIYYAPTTRDNDSCVLRVQKKSLKNTSRHFFFYYV